VHVHVLTNPPVTMVTLHTQHTVILGHLAPVFCLSFDSTGQRIIT
uniref:Uncharacterized protein n=1 Tax=Amphimedon queenslandica TaxID=400682 RepID=A0A1X7T6C9_AMPQE